MSGALRASQSAGRRWATTINPATKPQQAPVPTDVWYSWTTGPLGQNGYEQILLTEQTLQGHWYGLLSRYIEIGANVIKGKPFEIGMSVDFEQASPGYLNGTAMFDDDLYHDTYVTYYAPQAGGVRRVVTVTKQLVDNDVVRSGQLPVTVAAWHTSAKIYSMSVTVGVHEYR